MPRAISYEMEMMFVGSEGAFDQTKNTGQYISRIDFVQGYDFSFNVERQALKQIYVPLRGFYEEKEIKATRHRLPSRAII